jgi:sortase A
VGIAGHRTTYSAPFRRIDRLADGERIFIRMPYGLFTYEVEGQQIVSPERVDVLNCTRHSRLVLTACHPPESAAQRIVVFAKLVRQERPSFF